MPQQLPPASADYSAAQRIEIGAALAAVQRLWSRMGDDFDASYATIEGQLLGVLDTAQRRVVAGAITYVPDVLAETNPRALNRAPLYRLADDALVGTAGDGMSTNSLAYEAVIHAKSAVKAGATSTEALSRAGSWLSTAAGTLLSDTGRTAEVVTAQAHRTTTFVRMLNPPSCGRCIILAGTVWHRSTAFQRHPGCFPAGAVVSGPAPEAATRRWYEGELAVVTTASGKKLTATGNHPVLTNQGWVPSGLLQVGDYVLSSTLGQGAVPLVVPDEKQRPALIEDVWGSDSMVPLGQVPTAAEDFHGDGGHGEVDVVLPDRLLGHGMHASLDQLSAQELLARGIASPASLAGGRTGQELSIGLGSAPHRIMGGGGLERALLGAHLLGPGLPGYGASANLDALMEQALTQSVATDPEASAEAVLALSGLVGGSDLSLGQHAERPRWDAPAGPLTMESRVAYASRGSDLAGRLSGQVAADRVVKVERVQWSGHVYNLTSAEGWYCADGFIVSNCDCRNVPSAESIAGDMTVDPAEYLGSLDEQGLARALGSKANAKAYTDGADLNQLINAYRHGGDVRAAQVYGQGVKYTTEGTTRRGIANWRMQQSQAVKAGGRASQSPRLMPESIYQLAKDEADAQRLLRLYGWVL